MNTKFNIGDKVAVIGAISYISVTENHDELYDVTFQSYEGYKRTETFTRDQLFPASDLTLEEDDLK